jgi:hypothetical protein
MKEIRQLAGTMLKQACQSVVAMALVDTTVNRAYQSACSAIYNAVGSPRQHLTNESVTQLCNDEAIVGSDSLRKWTASCGPFHGLERPMMAKQRKARALNHCRPRKSTYFVACTVTLRSFGLRSVRVLPHTSREAGGLDHSRSSNCL